MAGQQDSGGQGARITRAPRRITATYLRRAALHYLERHAVPAAQLRKVLARKITASCRHHDEDPATHAALLDEVVAQCVSLQLVDDRRFAEGRTASLRRKGLSGRAVAGRLAAKGVERGLIEDVAATDADTELAAARIAVRRRRLGHWRDPAKDAAADAAALRRKDLAALARLGFSFAIARTALDEQDGEGR